MLGVLMYGFLYVFIHTMVKIGWWRLEVTGVENLPPRTASGMIIAVNHIHWIDIPIIGALLPFAYRLSWLAKAEIFENPFTRWFYNAMQVIPVKRGRRDTAALEASAQALRDGAVLLIFPEGHRSKTGVLQKGRGGVVRLAMQSGVPIVPLAITGTEHGIKGILARKRLCLRIGEPYTVAPLPKNKIPPDVMEELTTDMMQRIAKQLPAAYQGHYQQSLPTASV